PVFYLGATTGRDGLGGASFASREITEDSHEDRPAVQVGDPFMEKLLLEACLELIRTGYVVGIQDMGAAGLTCSTCETASRGDAGIEIDVSLVPKRETGMIPYEIMLSESQERMLVIVHKGKEKEVEKIFKKWDLHAVQIGQVTDGVMMRVKENGKVVSEIPAKALADEGPLYKRESKEPAYYKKLKAFDIDKKVKPSKDLNGDLKLLLGSWSVASKHWVWEQYDHMVRTNTVVLPGSDAAVLRIKDINRFLAMSTDCNGTFVYLDPYAGAQIAVAEASRNCVCSGAVPIGVTNCLNFGNPMKPEIFWQFKNAVQGLGDACRSFGIPVTGGNVSFYNESPKAAVDPTPSIGTVGLIEKEEYVTTQYFKDDGDAVVLLGNRRQELGGSEYLKVKHGLKAGKVPRIDLEEEKALHRATLEAIHKRLVKSAHDCSEGGLAVTLAESCMSGGGEKMIGCEIALDPKLFKAKRLDALLFGESQSRIVVSCAKENVKEIEKISAKHGVITTVLGTVGDRGLVIRYGGETLIDQPVSALGDTWHNSIERTLVTRA
ncbi:MAG TPA: phosphoribosylformylglycinamidine synthase subunit PurL, partial [bacterium]|nr:phosphoribosylformylglycinamidine synthase subunit PurL [bacterium]